MAKKKDQNEDPEEEKKNQFDEDEDFGLPDLDYDELEEEASDDPKPVTESDEKGESQEKSNSVEEVSNEELGEDWEKELEEELEEDLKSGNFDDTESFYEEETFDEFEDEVKEESVGSSVFGIDESEQPEAKESSVFEEDTEVTANAAPIETDKTESKTFEPQYSEYLDDNNQEKGKFTRVVVIAAVLFTVIGSVLWLLYDDTSSTVPEVEETVAVVEESTIEETDPLEVAAETEVLEPVEEEAYNTSAESVPNQVDAGTITILSLKTGKSYVVIGSFFDEDIANDYAQKLADQGSSPYVIPPFNNSRYYRIAIAEFDNFKDANNSVATFTEQYGKEAWPLRY